MTFQQLDIIAPILAAIDQQGYENPSPIQTEALPIILEGHDLLASAQTGTGKTAAFAIPIIQLLANSKSEKEESRKIKALVLSPTRELAEQIKESFKTYAGKLNIKTGAIYGGASQRGQEIMLKKGIDVLVATPGRLIDLMKQRVVSLSDVKYFVLDEADTLLDMGFIKDVKHIKGFITKERQTLMFSATVSPEVAKLAGELLVNPKTLIMAPPEMMIDKINHSLFYVEKKQKFELLLDLLTDPKLESVLVFTRTKHGANHLVKDLIEYGVKVDAIHGNKSQSARQQALNDFKAKRTRVLIATDIASRGIDIDDLSHVINYDLPESAETYVHRIGRTGRRGLKGEAFTFCSNGERALLRAVEKHTGLKLTVLDLKPVSEDSKFKRVVVAESQDKSRVETTSRPERPSNRRYVGEPETGKYKAKVEKKGNRRELVDTAPANFGKRKKEVTNKKKVFQNISESAFEDSEKTEVKEQRRQRIAKATEEGATRSYAKKTEGRAYNKGGYEGRSRTTEGGQRRSYDRPRTTEEGEKRSYNKTGYQGRRSEGGEGGEKRPYSRPRTEQGSETRSYNKTGYQGRRTEGAEGGEKRPYSRPRSTEGGEKRPYSRPRSTEGGEKRSYNKTGYQGRRAEGEGEKRSYSRPAGERRNEGYKGKKSFGRPNTYKSGSASPKTPFVEFGDGSSKPKPRTYRGKQNDFGAPKSGGSEEKRSYARPRTSQGGEKKSYSKSGFGRSNSSRPRTGMGRPRSGSRAD